MKEENIKIKLTFMAIRFIQLVKHSTIFTTRKMTYAYGGFCLHT